MIKQKIKQKLQQYVLKFSVECKLKELFVSVI